MTALRVDITLFRPAGDLLRGVSHGFGRAADALPDMLRTVSDGVFSNPLAALLVGMAIGACFGFVIAGSRGLGWR